LPGQRPGNEPGSGIRRPPPPPEPAPLPAEVYFDAQSRKKEEASREVSNEEYEPEEDAEVEADEVPMFQEIAKVYGSRTITLGCLLVQFSMGILMLPRIVNAAEILLEKPSHLVILAVLGVAELVLAGWSFWARSWIGALGTVALGLFWWVFLLAQIA